MNGISKRMGVLNESLLPATSRDSITLNMAQIVGADALSRAFQPSQSLGKILSQFLPDVLGLSPHDGFSNYSAEACHEFVHGDKTCSPYLARDNSCLSMMVTEQERGNTL